jgi:adenine C2-methylase RlmN of 23S rRNA A2503 and tRNA A37
MLTQVRYRQFQNGKVYALETEDGYPIEVTDTFLPFYTKDAIGRKQNALNSIDIGSRFDRWMIGVSVMSGCPVKCKFCATAQLKRCRNLTAEEIVQQVCFVLEKNKDVYPFECGEFKINYTRMGEPFLNVQEVRRAIAILDRWYPNIHHYISTIGIKGSDFSWIKENITLQFSIHSFDEVYRDWLIPYNNKMCIEEIGQVRTASRLKTTLNLTLVREEDFSIQALKQSFDPAAHFIKLSPINLNRISQGNELGEGVIKQLNLL